ncbi:MAG: YciI family protein [Acidimicrobiales bacterium]
MADYYLVETVRGPAWGDTLSRRQQAGWTAHAGFMDRLVEEGVILLGAPVGELDGDRALLVLNARDEDEVRTRLESDPWADGVLSIASIRPWSIWLRSAAGVDGSA